MQLELNDEEYELVKYILEMVEANLVHDKESANYVVLPEKKLLAITRQDKELLSHLKNRISPWYLEEDGGELKLACFGD
jgi:hypothetical protein